MKNDDQILTAINIKPKDDVEKAVILEKIHAILDGNVLNRLRDDLPRETMTDLEVSSQQLDFDLTDWLGINVKNYETIAQEETDKLIEEINNRANEIGEVLG